MKTKIFSAGFSLIIVILIIIFISCIGQTHSTFIPIPDSSYYTQQRTFHVDTDKIIDSKDGVQIVSEWVFAFLNGGIEEVEKLDRFYDRYVFIGINEGENFNTLNRWGIFFSASHDFPMLAAARIERRIIQSSFMYPDYEYGAFFEKLVKEAYNTVYPNTVKEDTYWIKVKAENETGINNELINETSSNMFVFFVLISIDKTAMQNIIRNMMNQTAAAVTPTAAQAASINRLRQNFFTGF